MTCAQRDTLSHSDSRSVTVCLSMDIHRPHWNKDGNCIDVSNGSPNLLAHTYRYIHDSCYCSTLATPIPCDQCPCSHATPLPSMVADTRGTSDSLAHVSRYMDDTTNGRRDNPWASPRDNRKWHTQGADPRPPRRTQSTASTPQPRHGTRTNKPQKHP